MLIDDKIIARFEAKIKLGKNGCWEWKSATAYYKYGNFWFGSKLIKAHRFSYSYYLNETIENKIICHHCDNSSCVNPFHLFEGTQSDNIRDCVNKNRLNSHNTNKTHCIRGHKLSGKNLYLYKNKRICKACSKMRTFTYRNKRKKNYGTRSI